MTILEIRTALNSRLGRSLAADALNAEIQLAVEDLSKLARWPDLRKVGSALAFTAGLKLKALPTGHRGFAADDGAVISGYRPLIKISWDDMRGAQEQESPTSGRPLYYCIRGKNLYTYPLADATYNVVPEYYQTHPDIGTEAAPAILFGDEFTEAVITKTIVQYCKTSKMTKHPKLQENAAIYQREIATLIDQADTLQIVTKPFVYGES
jgi:hypothetical protein